MSDANKDEVVKCKRIAQAALDAGDSEKAVRFLQKAKRMDASDSSIDALLEAAASGAAGGGAAGGGRDNTSEGPRQRTTASSTASAPPTSGGATGARTSAAGKAYTQEQMADVQRILRTKDYYSIMGLPRDAGDDAIKKAYRKGAVKLHPDKNNAPGAAEAFKKFSKAYQCLSDQEKKQVYDRYGDEDRMPQQQRRQYQQDFMTPEDLFSQIFGGGVFHHAHGGRHHHQHNEEAPAQRAQLLQLLPVMFLIVLSFASSLTTRNTTNRFSFSPSGTFRNERTSATVGVNYYVADDFEEHYAEGTRVLVDFEKQVELYYVRNLHSECDDQERMTYRKVTLAKRRGSQEELANARKSPKPACKELDRVRKRYPKTYRSAMYG
eukprot:CAMPEP_0117552870 /NCGR_PEP_ID=MMETSP0784-20121206/49932_1 /TAXON_ID=39447 /ORGANISM="" /LENGTH=378 /DNA_ID=CAMNT_0005349959 /DNA_START=126 /DNA_END=1262 /DNA_ORIENTATION=-